MRNPAAAPIPTRTAWDVPKQSRIARDMQRAVASTHAPVRNSYFHIPTPADTRRSQRIAKAAI